MVPSGSGSGVEAESGRTQSLGEASNYNQAKSPPVYEILCFVGLVMTVPEVAVTARERGR